MGKKPTQQEMDDDAVLLQWGNTYVALKGVKSEQTFRNITKNLTEAVLIKRVAEARRRLNE